MCYFIILRNKDTPLIEKKSNKCNLAISNTEKQKAKYKLPKSLPPKETQPIVPRIVLREIKDTQMGVYVYVCITFLLVLLTLNKRYSVQVTWHPAFYQLIICRDILKQIYLTF